MRKTILIAAAAFIGCVSAASAGDISGPSYKAVMPQSVYSWTGFYVGADGGGGLSQDSMRIGGGNSLGSAVVATGAVPNGLKTDPVGAFGGGFAGYNYQISPQFVLGIETDIQYSDIKGGDSRTLNTAPLGFPASLTTTGNSRLDWFGSTRGRVGYLITPTIMLYGTGGVAYGGVKDSASIVLTTPAPAFNGSAALANSSTLFGWDAGGGLEAAILPNISLRAEYQHIDLGATSMTGTAVVAKTPVSFTATQAHTYDTVRAGVSYKLPPLF